MTNQYPANYCMDNPEHQMFRATDGARCVDCEGMVNVKPVTKAKYNRLPTYQQLCNERKRPYQFKAQCLVCDHEEMVFHNNKEEYQEVAVCPKCKGAFVDTWKIAKYQKTADKSKQSISIAVDADTDKLQLKLRAIAKHTEALADELDRIDNAWQCDCGSIEYHDSILTRVGTDEVVEHSRTCSCCGRYYVMPIDDELPTHLEGSE